MQRHLQVIMILGATLFLMTVAQAKNLQPQERPMMVEVHAGRIFINLQA